MITQSEKMTETRDLVVAGVFFLCVCLLLAHLMKVVHGLWWVPRKLQNLLSERGIKGRSYRFIHGSTREIMAMKEEAMETPLTLSNHNIFPRLQPHIHSWTNLYGKNYVQWDGCQAELVVTEAELVKEVLTDRNGVFCKGKTRPFLKRLLGDGLVTSQGQKWAKVRKLANYAFHGESLKRMLPAMIESTETMLERWKYIEGQEIDVYEEFRLLTSEAISKTAFGSSYLEGKKIFEMLRNLVLLASRNFHRQTLPGLSKVFKSNDEIESERLEKSMRVSIIELIKRREEKAAKEEEENYGSDFLGLLVKAQRDADDRQRISVDDIIDECKTFYIGGHETSNSLLAWTMLLLALHLDWQEEARKEAIESSAKPDDFVKLKTMSMIINESLRLYPPVISIAREVKRETRLGTLDLSANVKLLISSLAVHHDTELWGGDAHLFKPERFAEGVAKATNNNMAAFVPFGLGPRNCVGFNFAIAEAKIALAMILRRYAFTLSPAYVHSPVQVLTVRPQHGIQVILRPL